MNENVLTMDSEPIASLLQSVRRSMKKADRLAESYRPPLDGERFMTDKEVSARLHVSRRTLQEYRNNGTLPYFILAGKVLYREHDVQQQKILPLPMQMIEMPFFSLLPESLSDTHRLKAAA